MTTSRGMKWVNENRQNRWFFKSSNHLVYVQSRGLQPIMWFTTNHVVYEQSRGLWQVNI